MRETLKSVLVGVQMLFVAFGALVLVPLLTGLNPSVALLSAGVGTLIFQIITKRQVPIFIGSSFAFIAPIIYAIEHWGLGATQFGLMAAGSIYLLLSFTISRVGTNFINRLFPPVVISPVIMVIGLSLAPAAANMAMGLTGDGTAVLVPKTQALFIAATALCTTIFIALYGKGLSKLLAVLSGVIVSYILSVIIGVANLEPIQTANWFAMPPMTLPCFKWEAVLFLIPVAIAPAIEHIGDVMVISEICEKDFVKTPGLHRTMAGDGLAVCFAGFIGGPPVTTYSEVTGAVSITGAKDPKIMTFAAITAILLAFSGKMSAFLSTIPTPIMGGIMLLLFGSIAAIGAKALLAPNANVKSERSVVIIAVTLGVGIGNLSISIGDFALLGYPVLGEITAYKAGHAQHLGLMQTIAESPHCWEIMEFADDGKGVGLRRLLSDTKEAAQNLFTSFPKPAGIA
ncbi:MAG: uracil permease [Deltaproteobacteria bacterium]|nr:MAG: uracil permease [Deltaproteobacteria bacterium]